MAGDKSARPSAKAPARPTARAAAADLLVAVLGEGAMLSQLALPESLPPSERARAERLATETLRHLDRIDRILKPLLRKAPPLPVLAVLRLAVMELAQGGAAHGVVNDAVGQIRRDRKTQHLSGLVNAVLRAVPLPIDLSSMPVPMLPRWLRQPLVHEWGREVVTAIEAVHCQTPPVDLTPKTASSLLPEGKPLPNGSLRLDRAGQVSALAGYDEGAWWVQDAAASMAARLLDVRKDERVLDLCAAPGGKTMQLAAAGAKVTALDLSEGRMARVRENLARTGLAAELVVADALTWQPDAPYDAILLDAPCSATGTIRRHPDLPHVKDGSEIAALVALQAALFDRALDWLAPGGRIVFCTCSLLPDEGEAQLAGALSRHPGLKVVRPAMPWVEPDWITIQGGLRLRPDHWAAEGGMDGFFMACLTRA